MKHVEIRTAAATIALAIALSSWTGALAQSPPASPPGQPAATAQSRPAAAKPKHDPEQDVICKEEETTGTRLGAHRLCHTRAEWRQMAHDSADWLNDPHRKVVQPHD